MTTLFHLPRRNRPGQHRLGSTRRAVPAPTQLVRVATAPDVTGAMEPLRDVIGGHAPLTGDLLARVRDGLRASMDTSGAVSWDPQPEPEPLPEPEPEPGPSAAAWLRAVIGGSNRILDPLGHYPAYAGWAILPDGRAVAGMFLGSNPDGHLVLDVTDPAWIDDAIEALSRMRDDLTATGDAEAGAA